MTEDQRQSLSGTCLCGAVAFRLSGAIGGFYLCHCHRCQKASGSAHGANLFIKDGAVDWLSGQDQVQSYQVPDSNNARSFCSCCGSPVPHFNEAIGQWQVPAGSLDTPITRAPDAQIFVASRPDWSEKRDTVRCFDALPE